MAGVDPPYLFCVGVLSVMSSARRQRGLSPDGASLGKGGGQHAAGVSPPCECCLAAAAPRCWRGGGGTGASGCQVSCRAVADLAEGYPGSWSASLLAGKPLGCRQSLSACGWSVADCGLLPGGSGASLLAGRLLARVAVDARCLVGLWADLAEGYPGSSSASLLAGRPLGCRQSLPACGWSVADCGLLPGGSGASLSGRLLARVPMYAKG